MFENFCYHSIHKGTLLEKFQSSGYLYEKRKNLIIMFSSSITVRKINSNPWIHNNSDSRSKYTSFVETITGGRVRGAVKIIKHVPAISITKTDL